MQKILEFIWKHRDVALATFRHYDGTTGEFRALNPFGKH